MVEHNGIHNSLHCTVQVGWVIDYERRLLPPEHKRDLLTRPSRCFTQDLTNLGKAGEVGQGRRGGREGTEYSSFTIQYTEIE